MSTRCNIEIYDVNGGSKFLTARLYHHSDGYPSFMINKIKNFLNFIKKEGKCNWQGEDVAACMVMLSSEDYEFPMMPYSTNKSDRYNISEPEKKYRPNNGCPCFLPCVKNHGDIDYIYKVELHSNGSYKISVK